MTRDDLIVLVERIIAAECSEADHQALVEQFERNVPHPRAADLIFYPEREMSAAETVDLALAYEPIALPGPTNDNARGK